MTEYKVSCFSPPSSLRIKHGDIVEVEGWRSKNHIRAHTITNMTESGPACRCGPPMKMMLEISKRISVKGKVGKVIQTSEGVEFELSIER